MEGSDDTGFVVTDNTVFAYINENGYSYTVYTGKNNAPSIKDATMCVKYDDNGYAEFVVVRDYDDDSNTFVAYITDEPYAGYTYPSNKTINGYNVYKLGETKATTIFDAYRDADGKAHSSNWFGDQNKFKGAGMYVVSVTSENFIEYIDFLVAAKAVATDEAKVPADVDSYMTTTVAFGYVAANPAGNSFEMVDENGNTVAKFGIFDDAEKTTYIKVENRTSGTILTEGSKADVKAGSPVVVSFDAVDTLKNRKVDAKVVYVFENIDDVETPVTAPSLTLKQNAPGQVQATYKSGSKETSVYVEYYYREAGDTSAKWNVLYTGTEHNYAADGSEVYSAKDLPTLGGSNKYDVYAVAYATKDLADYNKGDVVATSTTLKDVIA